MKDNILVGVLLNSVEVPAWQYYLIEQLKKSRNVSVRILILTNADPECGRATRPSALYRLFQRFDQARGAVGADACQTKSVDDLIGHNVTVNLRNHPFSQLRQQPTVLHEIKRYELDVVLALGGVQLIDSLCPASRYGVWFHWHDYNQSHCVDGSRSGFWEVLRRRPYVRSALVIRRSGVPNDVVAYESYSPVHRKSYSQTRNEHLWKVSCFVPRALKRLCTVGPQQFFFGLSDAAFAEPINRYTGKYRLTNGRLLFPMVSYALWRLWSKAIRKYYAERWVLLFSLSGASDDLARFKILKPPKDRFWADPHVFCYGDDFYIFIEDASRHDGHGRISVLHMTANGECSAPTTVIDRPYHLSYPFVFEWRNEIFLIPESSENGTIELYRCREFPFGWEFQQNLMEHVSAFDTTLVEYNGLWWMFTNIKAHPGASSWDELYLFYSTSPISRSWHAHPMNPIISDVRSARPAGKLYFNDNKLYRPSQCSTKGYGYSLNINRILELTTMTYRERIDRTLQPESNRSIRAVHTINQVGALVTVDAIYRSRTFSWTRSFLL